MKRLLLFSIVGLSVFAGCDKGDDDEIKSDISIVADGETNLIVGKTLQLHVKHSDSEKPAHEYEWVSSNSGVATVTPWGEVRAVAEGETVITVKYSDDITANCAISVVPVAITEIKLDAKYEAIVGGELQLSPKILPAEAGYKSKTLVYSSSDETIAKVNSNGKVETIGVGSCQIKAASSDGTISATSELTVKSIVVAKLTSGDDNSGSNYSIKVGESYKVKTTVAGSEWKSSNDKVVSITADGTFTGVSVGDCYITAVGTNDEVKAKFFVKVTK